LFLRVSVAQQDRLAAVAAENNRLDAIKKKMEAKMSKEMKKKAEEDRLIAERKAALAEAAEEVRGVWDFVCVWGDTRTTQEVRDV
jgi:hypothetical protein